MIVYLSAYSLLSIAAISNIGQRNGLYFLFLAPLLIWFMGFRYYVGCDFQSYLNRWIFFDLPDNILDIVERQEFGFELLMGISKASGINFTWFNVIVSTALVFCYIQFASHHYAPSLIIALLFPIIVVQLGMSGIRQALAGGLLMLAFNAFSERRRLRMGALIATAAQFHASAIIFLPLILLIGRNLSFLKLVGAFLILGPAAGLLLGDRVDVYEDRYGSGEVTSGGAIIRYTLSLLPVPFFLFYQRKIKKIFPDVFPLLKLASLMIIGLAPLVVLSSIALHRLNYYIIPLSILLCAYVFSAVFQKKHEGYFLVLLAYGAYSFSWFVSSRHAQICYIPYQNTWFM